MSLLQNIKRGVQQRPQRVIIYGPEGVGKSTLAAGLPALFCWTRNRDLPTSTLPGWTAGATET